MAYRRATSAAHREMPRSVLGLAARMGTRRGGRCPQPARHARIGPAATKRCSSPCSSRDGRRVFDLELPLEQAAEGYRAMDERRAIKTLLRPDH
jgi:hypothetical protein